MDINNPRKIAINKLKMTLPTEVWQNNSKHVSELRNELLEHPINNHPIIALLNEGKFNINEMKQIRLEYRHAIVKIFTDALLMTQFQSKQ